MTTAPEPAPTPARRPLPRWARAALAGVAGAVTVTLLNEGVRRVLPHAPRMDVIGERGLTKVVRAAGGTPPRGEALYWTTMAGDMLSNTAYYALIGVAAPQDAGRWGAGLGVIAGIGGALLPPRLGLGHQPHETATTRALTVAWYSAGGIAAAAVYGALGGQERRAKG